VSHQMRAIAFDLDAATLSSLQKALPNWEVEVVHGATVESLTRDWNPGAADLLIVNARADVAETLRLCRFFVQCGVSSTDSWEEASATADVHGKRQEQLRRPDAPVLVLVHSGHEALVRAALEAGADSCLVLPIHPKEVVGMLARVRQGNWPGRHTLDLQQAQAEDRWRDEGGQG